MSQLKPAPTLYSKYPTLAESTEALFQRLYGRAYNSAFSEISRTMNEVLTYLPLGSDPLICVDLGLPPIRARQLIELLIRELSVAVAHERITGELNKLLAAANALDNSERNR